MSARISLRKAIEQKMEDGVLGLSDISKACDVTEITIRKFLDFDTELTPNSYNRIYNFIFNDSSDDSPAIVPTMAKEKVNHPSHYNIGKIEVIDFIEDKKLGFNLGNVAKYICRAGHKDGENKREALDKAKWYLQREINEC